MVYESVTIVTITIRPSFQVFCKFQESFQDSFLTENAWSILWDVVGAKLRNPFVPGTNTT